MLHCVGVWGKRKRILHVWLVVVGWLGKPFKRMTNRPVCHRLRHCHCLISCPKMVLVLLLLPPPPMDCFRNQ